MSDENMTLEGTQKELAAARWFLTTQLGKEKRSLKIRLILGSVVTAIVLGYLLWLSSTLGRMGSPEYIREVIVTTIRSNGPQMVEAAKKEVLSHKRDIIEFLTGEGLSNLVEVLFKEGRESLEKLISRITNETMGELNSRFTGVLQKEGSRLRAILQNPEKLHVEEEIIKAFDDDLQDAMGQLMLDEDFKEPLSRKYKESLEQLNAINKSLEELAAKDTLTRRETLVVRFIKSWSGYVHQAGDEEPGPNRCNDGTTADPPPPKCEAGLVRATIGSKWVCVNPGTCQP